MTSDRLAQAIDAGDVEGVKRLLEEDPSLASTQIRWQEGGRANHSDPLHYLSDSAFHGRGNHDRYGEMARVLIDAGAPVEGTPGSNETPLIGAASLGQAEVANALVEAGADIEAKGSAVPGGGPPLAHAVHFGMPAVVDVLVEAGAKVSSLAEAAGVGDVSSLLRDDVSDRELAEALRAAVVCDRTSAIHQLLEAGVPIDTDMGGATALHWAAWEGKPAAACELLERGADPHAKDAEYDMTPLGWAKHHHSEVGESAGHDEVEQLLERV